MDIDTQEAHPFVDEMLATKFASESAAGSADAESSLELDPVQLIREKIEEANTNQHGVRKVEQHISFFKAQELQQHIIKTATQRFGKHIGQLVSEAAVLQSPLQLIAQMEKDGQKHTVLLEHVYDSIIGGIALLRQHADVDPGFAPLFEGEVESLLSVDSPRTMRHQLEVGRKTMRRTERIGMNNSWRPEYIALKMRSAGSGMANHDVGKGKKLESYIKNYQQALIDAGLDTDARYNKQLFAGGGYGVRMAIFEDEVDYKVEFPEGKGVSVHKEVVAPHDKVGYMVRVHAALDALLASHPRVRQQLEKDDDVQALFDTFLENDMRIPMVTRMRATANIPPAVLAGVPLGRILYAESEKDVYQVLSEYAPTDADLTAVEDAYHAGHLATIKNEIVPEFKDMLLEHLQQSLLIEEDLDDVAQRIMQIDDQRVQTFIFARDHHARLPSMQAWQVGNMSVINVALQAGSLEDTDHAMATRETCAERQGKLASRRGRALEMIMLRDIQFGDEVVSDLVRDVEKQNLFGENEVVTIPVTPYMVHKIRSFIDSDPERAHTLAQNVTDDICTLLPGLEQVDESTKKFLAEKLAYYLTNELSYPRGVDQKPFALQWIAQHPMPEGSAGSANIFFGLFGPGGGTLECLPLQGTGKEKVVMTKQDAKLLNSAAKELDAIHSPEASRETTFAATAEMMAPFRKAISCAARRNGECDKPCTTIEMTDLDEDNVPVRKITLERGASNTTCKHTRNSVEEAVA